MSDNKKFYYLKLKETFFDSEEMKLLENMENGYIYSNLYLKMCLKSLKYGGDLYFRDGLPYDPKMLSIVTGIPLDNVRAGLKILEQLCLIERLDSGMICMMDMQKLIGKDGTAAERMRTYRQKVREQKKLSECTNVQDLLTNRADSVHQSTETESEPEPEPDSDLDSELSSADADVSSRALTAEILLPEIPATLGRAETMLTVDTAVALYHELLPELSRVMTVSPKRQAMFKARLAEDKSRRTPDWWRRYFGLVAQSDWLTGNSSSGFRADFEWLITSGNMLKVIEGRYANRQSTEQNTAQLSGATLLKLAAQRMKEAHDNARL